MSELVRLVDEVISNTLISHFGHKEDIPICDNCNQSYIKKGIRQITYCDIKDSAHYKLIVHKRRFYCSCCKKYSKPTEIPGMDSDFKVTINAMNILTKIIENKSHWDKGRLASKLNRQFGIKINLAKAIIKKKLSKNQESKKKLSNDYLELF